MYICKRSNNINVCFESRYSVKKIILTMLCKKTWIDARLFLFSLPFKNGKEETSKKQIQNKKSIYN